MRIGEEIGFDPARFSDDVGSMRGAVARALWFDRVVSAIIAANSDGPCLSIGSGLDDRPARIGLPTIGIDWFDVEFPEVARLRTALITPRANVQCRMRSASLDLVADFAAPIMVRNSHRHPSVRKTEARFVWAVARPQDVTVIAPGLELIDEADIARHTGLLTRIVSWLFRFVTGRPAYFAARYRLSLGG